MIPKQGELRVKRNRRGPCVICHNPKAAPRQITDAASFTENNVLPFCANCESAMTVPRSKALSKLRRIVHDYTPMYELIGDDVEWLYWNGRRPIKGVDAA